MQTKETGAIDSLAMKPFFRALSYRDFFTSFSLAFLLVALQALVRYYSSEEWLESFWQSLNILIFILIIPVNHILYKIEHKRSNNYMGRVFHDLIFVAVFWVTNRAYTYLLTNTFHIVTEDTFIGIFAVIFFILLVMLFEAVVALLKRLLKLFKWQVL